MVQRTKHVQAVESGATDGSGASSANRPGMAENEVGVRKSSSVGDWDTDGAKSEGSTMSAHSSEEEPQKSREWIAYNHIAKYAKPDDSVAAWLTFQTMVVYWSLFAAACLYTGPLQWQATAVLVLLCGLTRTRVFCLMHDMAHHSFFSSKLANEVGAVLLGAIVYTPYSGWAKGHNYHHRHSNNTDRKQTAQTAPLTVDQFHALSPAQRLAYKCIYGHWTLLTTTPWLYFVVGQRFLSKWYENLLILGYWCAIYAYGSWRIAAIDMATAAVGASMGVFLFHIQHTFEGSYKAGGEDYSRFENGMKGSRFGNWCTENGMKASNVREFTARFLIVPAALKYFTAGIEYHNVHHLNTRVPLYKIQACFEEAGPIFDGVPTFTMLDALKRLPYSLRRDEDLAFVSCYDE